MRKTLLLLFLLPLLLSANYPRPHILYLIQAGNTEDALRVYRDCYQQTHKHDYDLIQEIGLVLLDQGYRSGKVEEQVLTLFGAGISMNERAFYILEGGLTSGIPQMQAIALGFMSKQQNDLTDEALNRAMKSDHALIRLEAAFHLCAKNYPTAFHQTECLMAKLPDEALPLFPQFYAQLTDKKAYKMMRRFLAHPHPEVRLAAIQAVANFKRDELLPQIRSLAAHPIPPQQEAAVATLGLFHDEASAEKIEALTKSPHSSVRLASLYTLYILGRKEKGLAIADELKNGDLFAIQLLRKIPGSEDLLAQLCKHENLQVRVNSGLALLEHADSRCLPPLCEILIRDKRDLLFQQMSSHGGSLICYKATPSGEQQYADSQVPFELSLEIREDALIKAVDLPEKDFLILADRILAAEQNDLVPVLVKLLETIGSPDAIALLKRHQQKVGSPLIRNYCNLALFRMKEKGPYGDTLRAWVAKQSNVDLIQFRPLLPHETRRTGADDFELTAQENSRLLIEAFEAIASTQDDLGINFLLEIIHNGNPKNKYALAGLLMRAGQ